MGPHSILLPLKSLPSPNTGSCVPVLVGWQGGGDNYYLMWLSLSMSLFLCLCVWNSGTVLEVGSSCCKSTRPSSGRIVSHHIRQMLSLQLVINMLATDPLKLNKEKCNLTLAVSPTCPQQKSSAYLLVTFYYMSDANWQRITAMAKSEFLLSKHCDYKKFLRE